MHDKKYLDMLRAAIPHWLADGLLSRHALLAGMAGDRGMRYPELAAGALQHLILPAGCADGYSSSRTCEVNMSQHSGVNFRGLVYLVDEATRPKAQAQRDAATA